MKLELLAAGGDVPSACALLLTRLFFCNVISSSPSHKQDSRTEGGTSTGFPIYFPFQRPTEGFWIFLMLRALKSS